MSRVAYVDPASGASGDMLLAAFVHAGRRLGLPVEEAVRRTVEGLGLDCHVEFRDATRGGLVCLVAEVTSTGPHTAEALRAAIERTHLGDDARKRALAGLDALLEAEMRVHGEQTAHLHDVGSADTAADLAGVSAAIDALGVTRLTCGPLPVPRGWVGSAHGPIPLPAPATLELLRGAWLRGVDEEAELVTPTAAAILVGHGATFGPAPAGVLEEVGTGGGSRELDRPNVCRVLIGTQAPAGVRLEHNVLLEANVDDQTPEAIARALGRALEAGARDAWVTPIVMKKSRPAFQLSVLVEPALEAAVLDVVFRETTTLGMRRLEVGKWVLDREVVEVDVRGIGVRVTIGRLAGEVVTVSPEFEDCAAHAQRSGVAFKDVYAEAAMQARRRQ